MRTCFAILIPGLLLAGLADGANVTRYRGPENNGVFPATGLLRKWPKEGPKLLWKHAIGDAWAGPAVVDGTVYIGGGVSGQLYAFSLDGELKFKYPFGSTTCKRFSGTRTVPIVSGDTAVVSAPNANLVGLNLKTGEWKWQLNAWKSFGSGKGSMGWGYPETPMSFGDLIAFNTCSRDDQSPPIVAVNIHTGQKVWEADPGQGKKYSAGDVSGSYVHHGNGDLFVITCWRGVLCLDAKTGQKYWEIPTSGEPSLTPVYSDGRLLVGLSGGKASMLRLLDDGKKYKELWTRGGIGGLPHAVILDGRVYSFGGNRDQPVCPVVEGDEEETEEPKKTEPPAKTAGQKSVHSLLCLDAETGRLIHSAPSPEGGHVIAADGMVYAITGGGNIALYQPTREGFEPAGQFALPMGAADKGSVHELSEQRWVCPVIAEGRLFIVYGPLWVYDLRAEADSYGYRCDGSGCVPNARPPVRWWREQNLKWTASLPAAGQSSPVTNGKRVLVTCGNDALACVDAAAGSVLWKAAADPAQAGPAVRAAPPDSSWPGPTPVVREQRVFAAFNTGVVACYDLSGKRVWIAGVEPARKGQPVGSPVLSENVLVLQARQLHGLDIESGKTLWTLEPPAGEDFGTPFKVRLAETNVLLTGWGSVVRAADGKTLTEGLPQMAGATPVAREGVAYYCGRKAAGKGSTLAALRLPARAAEGMKPERIWQNDKLAGVELAGSPLVHEGLVYVLSAEQELHVLDAKDGTLAYSRKLVPDEERLAQARGAGLALTGGNIYACNLGKKCRTVILRAGRQFEEVWQYAVEGGAGDPAFADDRQFVRCGATLFCLGGATPSLPQQQPRAAIAPVDVSGQQGAPSEAFEHNKIPDAWVFAGPFPKRSLDTDHLAGIGGRQKAIPRAGRQVAHGQTTLSFQQMTGAQRWTERRFTAGMNSIDLTAVVGRKADTTAYLFTIVDNDRPRYARFVLLTPDGLGWNYKARLEAAVWLAGQRISEKDVLQLAKGSYPLMIQATLGEVEGWGKVWMGPRFLDVTEEFQAKQATFEKANAGWPAYLDGSKQLFVLRP